MRHCDRFWAMSPNVASHRSRLSRGPHPDNLHLPTGFRSIVKDFIYSHSSIWPTLPFFHRISTSANIAQRGIQWSGTHNTCPNHVSRWRFITSSIAIYPSTKCPAWVLFTLSSHNIQAILRRLLWSMTWSLSIFSVFIARVSHPYLKTEQTSTRYTRTFIERRILQMKQVDKSQAIFLDPDWDFVRYYDNWSA